MQRDGPNLQVYFGQEDGIGPSGWAGMQRGHGQWHDLGFGNICGTAQREQKHPTNDPDIRVPNSFLWA